MEFIVFVTVPPDDSLMCKPEFTEPLKDLEIIDGEKLSLQCTVNGDPEPQIVRITFCIPSHPFKPVLCTIYNIF